MPVSPITPKGVQPIKVNFPTPVINQLKTGIYNPNAQVTAKGKDGKNFVTTLTNVIDWLLVTGTRVADVLQNLGVVTNKSLQKQIPQYEIEPSVEETEGIELTTGNNTPVLPPKEKEPITPPKPETKYIKVLGLEVTNGEAVLGAIALGILAKKAKIF